MPTSTRERAYTPPEIAKKYGVHPTKVIHWIKTGELVGVDMATRPGGRPRYRVTPADLELFLQRRQACTQTVAPQRRRRRQGGDVIKFY
jgi:transposase